MAKPRKKKRTHVQINSAAHGPGKAGTVNRPPKSMVVRMGAGEVGASVSQLTKDFRGMMEPDTASRLRERKSNKLKDYTTMAGPLGVTHLFLFSKSKSGNTNLRIAPTPRGPTLHFRIEKYSLCKDIAKAQKRPRGGGKEYLTAPLLVMNNMVSPEGGDSLDPRRKDLESLTRGISKRLRRFDPAEQRAREKKGRALPNLGQLDDMADYLLDPAAGGYTSASETELDTDAEVEVLETTARKVLSKREVDRMKDGDKRTRISERRNHVEKRAVKLVELGPRMSLRLVKVEEGLCDGRVMWNEFVSKSKAEVEELDQKWDVRRQEKEARRKEQKENVERKRQLKANTQANTQANTGENGPEDDEADDDDAWDSEDYEDAMDEDLNKEIDGDDEDMEE